MDAHRRSSASASETSETLLWGTPYRAMRRIGRGGMGEVFEAEHVALAKPVVVKLLHPDLSGEARLVERMRIEAQVLARLTHPNLVAVTDLGRTAEGRTYLVMERLHGRTLAEELSARGALPPLEAIDRVSQTLAGLAAAHGAGVVHRDVTLENLFLCAPDPAGRRSVKVLDFGVAKLVATGLGAPAPPLYQTAPGVLVGSPRYLAPEQIAGRPVDARTDVYAAGVVLYALLAGRFPFDHAARLGDLLHAHAAEPPEPPSRHRSAVPPALDRAVLRALEKDPECRFPSAAAFAAELARVAAVIQAEGAEGGAVAAAGAGAGAVAGAVAGARAGAGAGAGGVGLARPWRGALLGLLLAAAVLLGFVLAMLLRPGG